MIRDINHSRRTAPIMAVTICPTIVEPQWIPIHDNTLPPIKPPTMPTIRLTTKPNPEPFMILPARKPANAPMIILIIMPMGKKFKG